MENNHSFPPFPPQPPFGFPPPPQPEPEPFYNRFLQAGREGKNDWWRYLVGILLTFGAGYSIIGAIPLIILIFRGVLLNYFTLAEVQSDQQHMQDPVFLHVSLNVLFFCLLFIFVAAFVFLWIAVRFVHKKRFLSIINATASRLDLKRFLFGAFLWLCLSAVQIALSYFSDPSSFKLVLQPGPFIGSFLICLLMLPIQTGWEELFMRGYLMQGLNLWLKKPIIPWLITSLLFGIMHMANTEVSAHGVAEMLPQYTFMGLFFGFIALLDERLEVAWGIHFANNFVGFLATTSPDMSVQSNAIWSVSRIGGFSDFLISLVPTFIVLAILWRVYKWNIRKLTRSY